MEAELGRGAKIAFMTTTRDGGRMFLYDGDVERLVGTDMVEVKGPLRITEHAVEDVNWTGKRFEIMVDGAHQEAPRRRGEERRVFDKPKTRKK